jgi:hypothetical protein
VTCGWNSCKELALGIYFGPSYSEREFMLPFWILISFFGCIFIFNLLLLLFCFFEIRSRNVAQAGLELMILLLQLHECWDYKPVSPCPVLITSFFFKSLFYDLNLEMWQVPQGGL